MTKLAYAARNFLAQQSSVTSLVGTDTQVGEWLFVNVPEATVENSSTCLVVIYTEDGWGANQHNTARFPTLVIDIWADPTRNPDRSVRWRDADLKAEAVYLAIDKHLHRVSNSEPGGASVIWGTAEEIANKTGVRIISSSRVNEPSSRPAFDDQGAVIWTVRYDVSI